MQQPHLLSSEPFAVKLTFNRTPNIAIFTDFLVPPHLADYWSMRVASDAYQHGIPVIDWKVDHLEIEVRHVLSREHIIVEW